VADQQQLTGNPLDQLREAQGVFLEVLSNVRPEQMNLPTPDDEWDVRALVNHVVWALREALRMRPRKCRPAKDIPLRTSGVASSFIRSWVKMNEG
jgi:hypothetical protein